MEAREIFDNMKQIGIYIVDRETMITYYENPIAQKYSVKDRIGKPCYSIHGNNSMCSTCPIRTESHMSIVNRSDHNMVFAVRSTEIMWEGHPAYMISVARQSSSRFRTDDEMFVNRMSRALGKTINVYTEINMDTMQYHQINLRDAEHFSVDERGDYETALEHMCREEIFPEDVRQVRQLLSPEAFQRVSFDSEGADEVVARYRLKNTSPMRIMESRAVFVRDEIPHYVICMARDVTTEVLMEKQVGTMESILNHVSCGVAIYSVSKDKHIVCEYINDGLSALAECSKESLIQAINSDPMVTVNKPYRRAVSGAIMQVASGEKSASVTYGATTFAGNHPWVMLELTGAQGEDGITRIYGTFYDITASVEIQREFREKYEAEKRRSQDDTSVLAYAVFNLRTHTTIEMERRKPFATIEDKMSLEGFRDDIATTFVSSEKRSQFVQMFNPQTLMQMHKNGIDEQSIEYQRILPDGKIIWVKSSFHIIADSSGSDILMFYYCNDINLSKSLELITTYMANEDYDMLGCINFTDDSAILLYGTNSSLHPDQSLQIQESYSDALDWFINNAVVPEEREKYRAQAFIGEVRRMLALQDNYEMTIHTIGSQGSVLTKKVRYSRYDAESGICFFSQTDITEALAEEEQRQESLKAALVEAKQANEAKSLFLARMSHDIRTPMNGILGMINLAKDNTNPPDTDVCLDKMKVSCGFLLDLINDILDLSKIESGKVVLHPEAYPPAEFKSYIDSVLLPMCAQKSIKLVFKITNNLGNKCPCVDKLRINQILFNLVSNAVKFTPEKGTVTVSIWYEPLGEDRIRINGSVSDTGIGMSKEFQQHMFDSFTQEEQVLLPQRQGSGLGLSIVKSMMELMDGTVTCDSELGKGSTFTVAAEVPIVDVPHVSNEKSSLGNMQIDDILRGRHVLLAEDHHLNQEIAKRLLEKKSVIVNTADNGEIALKMFESSGIDYYDLILMDIRMPVMDGLTATKQIRALSRADAKTVPIIAMTANAFDEDRERTRQAGMNAHLAKPIDPPTMYATMAKKLLDPDA